MLLRHKTSINQTPKAVEYCIKSSVINNSTRASCSVLLKDEHTAIEPDLSCTARGSCNGGCTLSFHSHRCQGRAESGLSMSRHALRRSPLPLYGSRGRARSPLQSALSTKQLTRRHLTGHWRNACRHTSKFGGGLWCLGTQSMAALIYPVNQHDTIT